MICLNLLWLIGAIGINGQHVSKTSDDDLREDIDGTKQEVNALREELAELKKGFNDQGVHRKRLVLHSDLDIEKAFQDLRHEIDATKHEIDATKQENNALRAELDDLRKGQGSTYVRWGRTTCSGNGTEKVYSGYTGGSPYHLEGGASSNLCLPENPSWAHYIDGVQNRGGYLYGTEYETYGDSNTQAAFADAAFGKPMHNQDAPCVVCRSPRPVTIMIPGSTGCYAGWTLEYTGYLMVDSFRHSAATDYACVDKDPEAVFHGEADQNGKLFFFTEVQCGSLPCQEYPQGRELACTVCSK